MATLINTTRISRDGFIFLEHRISVPLDHHSAERDPAHIEIFAREIVVAGAEHEDRPTLLWFNGGPGHASERPGIPSGWLGRALEEYRVILLDQRGTGRSSAVNHRTLPHGSIQEQSDYLTLFRADSIVRDAECLRSMLIGERRWSVLGQSFGGFCALSYLSLAPSGLDAVMITGGIPDLHHDARHIYRATFMQTAVRNREFFATYPEDRQRVRELVAHLRLSDERLPTGERLSPERFLSLGILLGTKNGFDQLHYLLENAWLPENARAGVGAGLPPTLSESFLVDAGAVLSFAKNPLYAVLHEAIYADHAPTGWAAQSVREELPEFAEATYSDSTDSTGDDGDDVLFTGEMIFPWQFEQDPALTSLREVAEHLARRTDWPPLYDTAKLAANTVPAAAIVYTQDMFVPAEGSRQTATGVGNLRVIESDQYQHDGIRQDGAGLLEQLLAAVRC
ncbi:alpha/beta fold hydrolase [Psychromicrobium xiongbiense]|uniref:alpha/beta fold hydrolase n=1 Tax=Psychromicrobium xiongbiense TaxID=3051184 RepID=UPI002555269F|nr:alpha/beta fold hydrolase [Psychromicrobium sp. YIM S02556]